MIENRPHHTEWPEGIILTDAGYGEKAASDLTVSEEPPTVIVHVEDAHI